MQDVEAEREVRCARRKPIGKKTGLLFLFYSFLPEDLLDGAKGNLYQRVDQRTQRRVGGTASRGKYVGPQINTVDELPIAHVRACLLGFILDGGTESDRELADVQETELVADVLVHDKELDSHVAHHVDSREGVGIGALRATDKFEVGALQTGLEELLRGSEGVRAERQGTDGQEALDTDIILGGHATPDLQEGLEIMLGEDRDAGPVLGHLFGFFDGKIDHGRVAQALQQMEETLEIALDHVLGCIPAFVLGHGFCLVDVEEGVENDRGELQRGGDNQVEY